MIQIPGQALEQAAAEIGTDAGKTIIGAIRRRMDAWSAVRSAKDEADAEEIKTNIAHKGGIDRARELASERRENEIREIEHVSNLSAQALRGLYRFNEELLDGQKRVEWVGNRSVQIANSDTDGSETRDIPDDWLKRFFKYVADVDETALLEILARGLADAAMRKRPILNPKALDTLRFFELSSFRMFEYCAFHIGWFEALPADMLENIPKSENLVVDIVLMRELGLVKEERKKFLTYRIGNFYITFSYDSGVNFEFRTLEMTYVGKSIAGLIDRNLHKLDNRLREVDLSNEIVDLQRASGLNAEFTRRVARYLLIQIGETGSLDIKARLIKDGQQFDVFSRERKRHTDTFSIDPIRDLEFNDSFTKANVEAFVDEFQSFDNYQLPNMYTDDNR